MPGIDDVRRLALALPDIEERTSYRTPAWKVRGKLFARLREDGETLAIFVDFMEREALIAENPRAFEVTDHYRDYPMVLVHLGPVDPEELRELLIESWRRRAPKWLLADYDDANPPSG